jgi:hypothetical protein
MADGLGEALSRFNSNRSSGPGEVDDKTLGADKGKGKKSVTGGHHYEVHVHKGGTHHLLAHKGGQLMHHSEHGSMEEAAQAMIHHAGGGEAEEAGAPSEPSLES